MKSFNNDIIEECKLRKDELMRSMFHPENVTNVKNQNSKTEH
jgi:hypothetical protein